MTTRRRHRPAKARGRAWGKAGRSLLTLCSATTRSGEPCRFTARRESGLCINHDPAYKAQQRENTLNGTRASAARRTARAAEKDEATRRLLNPDPIALDTRAGVQAILETVLRLELTGAISAHRVRTLVRMLSIAVRNFDRPVVQRNGPTYAPSYHDPDAYQLRREALTRLFPSFSDAARDEASE